MIKFPALIVSLFIFLCNQAPVKNNNHDNIVDSVLKKQAEIFLAKPGTVGVSIGLYRNGETYMASFGSTTKTSVQLPDSQTIYGIASITKTFTGLLLANAVAEGKVKADDDIRKYLDGEYPNLAYNGQPIKLFHLISHVSRLPFFLSDRAETPGYTRADFYNDLHHVVIDTLPGVKFKYSNAAAQLLGYILEKIYGMPYEELLHEKITGPLKMKDTYVTLPSAEKKKLAMHYNMDGSYNPQTYDYMQGAAGIKTSVADLLKYMVYQTTGNDTTIQLSRKESWGFNMGKGKRYSYALGWQITTTKEGLHRISQDGILANCSAVIIFCPELKSGIVVCSNSISTDAVSALADETLHSTVAGMP
ncbi:serine hydrolase domain-containing protein [Chitinophagaceae bacterium LWZ2-11]